MRLEMEHLLYRYGADIVLQGHVHSCAPLLLDFPLCLRHLEEHSAGANHLPAGSLLTWWHAVRR